MKILHIVSGDLWAGAEAQALSLILGSVCLHSVSTHVIILNEGALASRLRSSGIPVTILDESQHNVISLIKCCREVIRSFLPDVVHMHGFKENFVGGTAARLGRVKKTVRTHHGKGMIGTASRYDVVEYINARFLTDEIIAVSHDMREFLVDSGLPIGKISVIHNGIDVCKLAPEERIALLRSEIGIGKDEKVIGTVGRLVPIKDHKTLLDGAKVILDKHPRTRFVITGDGPLMQELVRYAEALGISKQLCFTGFRQDTIEIIAIFDIFVMTSLHEGIPMALLEAMGLRKSVVVTRVGGMREVVEDNVSGLLVDTGDSISFGTACIRLLEDKGLRDSIAENAYSTIMSKFLLDATVRQTHSIYQRT